MFKKISYVFVAFILSFCLLTSCKKKESPPKVDPDNPHIIVAESISFSQDSYELYIGERLTFSFTITPSNAAGDITLKLQDETKSDLVKIDNDSLSIEALKDGKFTLEASINTGDDVITTTAKVTILHKLLDNEENTVSCVVGSFGENASTSYNIHYQTLNTKTFALVTKVEDTKYESATAYYGDGYYFEDLDELLNGPFSARNVWQIDITDLEPNTSYMYKIDDGKGNYTDNYYFTTAGGDKTSFLFMTDVHYYEGTAGGNESAAVSEEVVNQALIANPDIQFIAGGGDMIDTGGNDKIWQKYYSFAGSLKKLPFISVPGNHEYYINGTGQRDNKYFAAFSAGNKNGAGDLYNSSSWFIHNKTLFIMLDSVKNTSYDEQVAWMTNLLETKEYTYSVIIFHAPVHFRNGDYDPIFLDVFDKYGVDLVLCGHYHSQSFYKGLYEEVSSSDPLLGTTYLTGAAGGIKGYAAEDAIHQARGYMIDITNDNITIRAIYADGTIKNISTLNNKKETPKEEISEYEIMSNLNINYDKENSQLNIAWEKSYFGTVKKVICEETYRNTISNYSFIVNSSYTNLKIKDVISGYDYLFKISIILNNDKILTTNFNLNLHENIDINSTFIFDTIAGFEFEVPDNDLKFQVKNYKVVLTGAVNQTFTLNAIDSKFDVIKNQSLTIEDLKANSKYKLEIQALDSNGNILYTESIEFQTEE